MTLPDENVPILYAVEWYLEALNRFHTKSKSNLSPVEIRSLLSYGGRLLDAYQGVMSKITLNQSEIGRLGPLLDMILPDKPEIEGGC